MLGCAQQLMGSSLPRIHAAGDPCRLQQLVTHAPTDRDLQGEDRVGAGQSVCVRCGGMFHTIQVDTHIIQAIVQGAVMVCIHTQLATRVGCSS